MAEKATAPSTVMLSDGSIAVTGMRVSDVAARAAGLTGNVGGGTITSVDNGNILVQWDGSSQPVTAQASQLERYRFAPALTSAQQTQIDHAHNEVKYMWGAIAGAGVLGTLGYLLYRVFRKK